MTEAGERQEFDFDEGKSAADWLKRIRERSRDEVEKGRWFENLFMQIVKQSPEFEVDGIWRWTEWPERETLTGLDGTDNGIDLVARLNSGEMVAIQCKCYEDSSVLPRREIDKFLGGSQHEAFGLRWIVVTCRWGRNAERAIRCTNVRRIDFEDHAHVCISQEHASRPVREPWPLQNEAIKSVVSGLGNHDRGRLIMACGTGKTFTSLRIAEQVVHEGGRILFAAPTIALVSQARREWLRQTEVKLQSLVVCSDTTAGGRNPNEDIGISELECPVTTDPSHIAQFLEKASDSVRVVFCTYQSLRRVTEAQALSTPPLQHLT